MVRLLCVLALFVSAVLALGQSPFLQHRRTASRPQPITSSGQPITNSLYAWYDARTYAGTTDGTALSAWTNSWLVAAHMTNGNSGSQPLYKVNVSGTHGAFQFDNTDDFYTNGLPVDKPFTLGVIEMANGVTSGNHRTLNSTINSLMAISTRDANNAYVGGNVSDFKAEGTKPHIAFLVVSNGGGSFYYVDGTNQTTTPATENNWGLLTMGANGEFAETAACNVFHVLVWTNALTISQLDSNRTFFKTILPALP